MLDEEVKATITGKTKAHLVIFNHYVMNFLQRQTKCTRCTDTAEITSVNICCKALKSNLATEIQKLLQQALKFTENTFFKI